MIKKHFANGNLWLALAFVVMCVLFYSSSQTYQEQSQVGNLEHFLQGKPFFKELSSIHLRYGNEQVSIEEKGYYPFVEFFIRKFAHFATYFFLSFFLFLGLRNKFRKSIVLFGVLSWLAASGYAGLDEFHQMLTGGRTARIEDVALDSSGAFCAVAALLLLEGIKKIRK
ncbi:VanZ like family protein [Pilibacter termitis]|uniref:VanZ like family protein n=1 Tax=Pilibacter termitis TaxID=263852 RepID=A0A1T4P5R7_9ENTE|nr:VanZ family protein [Pilibacter termitis]SJZ86751.1 VanZ like family protein [Pilibacter termitis]